MINETTMIVGVSIEDELFMKILFMADMSVKYIETNKTQSELNEVFLDVKKEIKRADFSILNLENVFGNKEDYKPIIKDGPNLISNDDSIEFVKAISPSIVGMANNHAGDYGEKALIHTIKLLSAESIAVIGAGENSDKAYQPVRIEKDGLKVSILAVCENEFGIATERAGGAAGFDLSRVYSYIKEATMVADSNVQLTTENGIRSFTVDADVKSVTWLDNGKKTKGKSGKFEVIPFGYGTSLGLRVARFKI